MLMYQNRNGSLNLNIKGYFNSIEIHAAWIASWFGQATQGLVVRLTSNKWHITLEGVGEGGREN